MGEEDGEKDTERRARAEVDGTVRANVEGRRDHLRTKEILSDT